MSVHQTSRMANSQWCHHAVPTKKSGQLRIRQNDEVMQITGRGGFVQLRFKGKRLTSFCDGGFWFNQIFRFYDIATRLNRGEMATHAAAIKKNNQVWLLAGKSGAGKSTASAMAENQGWLKLQDDLVFLKEGRYQAAVDWADKAKPKCFQGFPVKGIVLLEQAIDHRLIPIDYKEALLRLGPVWGHPKVQDPTEWLGMIDREVSRIPVYRLRFRKDPDFLRLLENK